MRDNRRQENALKVLEYATDPPDDQPAPISNSPDVPSATLAAIDVLVREEGLDGDMAIQCALLYDMIQDVYNFYEKLVAAFGPEVAEGVLTLARKNILEAKKEK